MSALLRLPGWSGCSWSELLRSKMALLNDSRENYTLAPSRGQLRAGRQKPHQISPSGGYSPSVPNWEITIPAVKEVFSHPVS